MNNFHKNPVQELKRLKFMYPAGMKGSGYRPWTSCRLMIFLYYNASLLQTTGITVMKTVRSRDIAPVGCVRPKKTQQIM
jgi:hypothetical protein